MKRVEGWQPLRAGVVAVGTQPCALEGQRDRWALGFWGPGYLQDGKQGCLPVAGR